ncbi:protein of unknown function [Taphrina deformans PYCC 5710]|uniref:Uncharacterized protein n=1 Tax=Taphrina deformans (strain PYCC 5710 / ATCC 11124 / CBS 356.35 / IMI 108563 / JCM 9778 / NBRC 8474) TaxID=1097556 RepID=R4XDY1_TAPDE|nr:protein of unknown function [Taphrina deformans PYCC 5710]|eukprot:CCG82610.1 protein of unknown function [Taphrina deformans PYCC 5710]
MTQATVWAGRGPRDAVNDRSKVKPNTATKRGRFGMKLFSAQTQAQSKPLKSKLRLYASAEQTTLVPRLSATEANDNDDFDNFTSTAPNYGVEKRHSAAPSIGKSSLRNSVSRNNSLHNTVEAAETSVFEPLNRPVRMSSIASSGATSSSFNVIDDPVSFSGSSGRLASALPRINGTSSPAQTASFPSPSRSGSPTQLQQYTMQHVPSDSESDDIQLESRPKLFIANADVDSDSD